MKKRSETRVGKVCAKHPELKGERYPSPSYACVACARAYSKSKAARLTRKRRYIRNPQAALDRGRKWRRDNPETQRRNDRAHASRRRAQKRAATVPLTAADHLRIVALYAEAARRTSETGIVHHVDHDKPLALGGVHHPDNLLIVPAAINLAKGARYASTWEFITS